MTLEEKHVAILIASIPDNLSKGFFFWLGKFECGFTRLFT